MIEPRSSPDSSKQCCMCCHRAQKVAPLPTSCDLYDVNEVRPNRYLRVRHNKQKTLSSHKCEYPRRQSLLHRHPLWKDDAQLQQHTKNKTFETSNCRHPNVSDDTESNPADITISDTTSSKSKMAEGTSKNDFSEERIKNSTKAVNLCSTNIDHVSGSSASLREATAATSPNDTVIFMIHGVGGSSDVWLAQIHYFELLGYDVIAPDLIGHGFSSAPSKSKAYRFCEIEKDILILFDRYHGANNVVIGHSYGASFAAVLSRKRSNLVKRLIMISGGTPTPLAPQPGIFSCPLCLLNCCKPIMLRGFKRSAFHVKGSNISPPESAFDVPTYVLKSTMNGQLWLEGDDEYHSYITTPALLIHGRHDKLITLEEEQEMEEAIPGSLLVVINDSSHMVMMEKPAEVNQLIHEFITVTLHDRLPNRKERHSRPKSQSRSQSIVSLKSIPNNIITSNLKS